MNKIVIEKEKINYNDDLVISVLTDFNKLKSVDEVDALVKDFTVEKDGHVLKATLNNDKKLLITNSEVYNKENNKVVKFTLKYMNFDAIFDGIVEYVDENSCNLSFEITYINIPMFLRPFVNGFLKNTVSKFSFLLTRIEFDKL